MTIQDRIEKLRAAFEERTNRTQREHYPNLKPVDVSVRYGPKYAKIVRDHSISAFVHLETGDIYYPAGWKAPAKHVRGSVLADDYGLSCFGDYGVKTLR